MKKWIERQEMEQEKLVKSDTGKNAPRTHCDCKTRYDADTVTVDEIEDVEDFAEDLEEEALIEELGVGFYL